MAGRMARSSSREDREALKHVKENFIRAGE